jgi:predicted nucleic acid-binding protein
MAALEESAVLIHPWVIGELACGNLRDRNRVLELLQGLPAARVASPAEVLTLIEQHQLMRRGIGFLDAQLLASAKLTHCSLWTQDRPLADLAQALGVSPARGGETMAKCFHLSDTSFNRLQLSEALAVLHRAQAVRQLQRLSPARWLRGLTALHRKMTNYQANGAQLGWLLIPHQQAVEIWHAVGQGEPERIDPALSLDVGPLLLGLQIGLQEIWSA